MNRLLQTAILGAMLSATACAHVPAGAAHGYSVSARYPIGGAGGWDLLAVDSSRHHLFLSRGDHLDIVDTRDGKRIATLAGTDGVHAIAIVPGLHRGFASNGHADTLTEFDLDSLQRVSDIKLSGHSPDAMVFDPFSGHLFVFNAHSNNASVIDPASGKEIAVIAFNGNPELGASDGKGHVYVNIEDKSELVDIDAGSMRVLQTWPLPGCEEPTGLALDIAHARLFSACHNKTLAITDARNGHQVALLAIDEGPDGAAFDPQRQLAFIPNGRSGTLTIVHEDEPDHFRAIQTVATQPSARTLAYDPASGRLYLPAARFQAQAEGVKGRPPMLPDSFSVLVVEPAH